MADPETGQNGGMASAVARTYHGGLLQPPPPEVESVLAIMWRISAQILRVFYILSCAHTVSKRNVAALASAYDCKKGRHGWIAPTPWIRQSPNWMLVITND